jgi:hypothetical protein
LGGDCIFFFFNGDGQLAKQRRRRRGQKKTKRRWKKNLENVEKLEMLGKNKYGKGVGRGITRPNGNETLKYFFVVLFFFD